MLKSIETKIAVVMCLIAGILVAQGIAKEIEKVKPQAVSMTKELPTGVTITAWKVSEIVISLDNDSADVQVLGYLSKEAMDAGKQPIEHKQVRVHGLKKLDSFEKVVSALTAEVMKDDAFTGATVEVTE